MIVDDTGNKVLFRVVTIGDSSVGKTCVLNRILNHEFNPQEQNTIGALYHSYNKEINGITIEIQLWDTAGQEQYRSLAPVYFRGSSGAIIMFDITNRLSFEDVDDWLQTFRTESGDNTVMFLIGNKIDREEDRQVSFQEAQQWAIANHCSYYETSALTNDGIPQLIDDLVNELYKTQAVSTQRTISVATPKKTESNCNC